MFHIPSVFISEGFKVVFAWVRKKLLREKRELSASQRLETPRSNTQELEREIEELKARLSEKSLYPLPELEYSPDEGVYWNKEHTIPYCKSCFDLDRRAFALDPGATRGVFYCPVHDTSYWTREYRERSRTAPPRFRSWTKQRAYLEAQARRRVGY